MREAVSAEPAPIVSPVVPIATVQQAAPVVPTATVQQAILTEPAPIVSPIEPTAAVQQTILTEPTAAVQQAAPAVPTPTVSPTEPAPTATLTVPPAATQQSTLIVPAVPTPIVSSDGAAATASWQQAKPDVTEAAVDQGGLSSTARKKGRRGIGAQILGGLFKAIAVLIWLSSIAALVILGSDILNTKGSANLADLVRAFVDSGATTVLGGFVVGLISFGIGEAIGLLNDIRRNTWR